MQVLKCCSCNRFLGYAFSEESVGPICNVCVSQAEAWFSFRPQYAVSNPLAIELTASQLRWDKNAELGIANITERYGCVRITVDWKDATHPGTAKVLAQYGDK